MIDLNDDNRLRYLWHFLIQAAPVNLPLRPESIHKVFGTNKSDFEEIAKMCAHHKFFNLIDLIKDERFSLVKLDQDMIKNMFHGVPNFPSLNSEENDNLKFLISQYCSLIYTDSNLSMSLNAAFDFWLSLDDKEIPDSIRYCLNQYLFDLNLPCFHHNKFIAKVDNYKLNNDKYIKVQEIIRESLVTIWQEFKKFTSDHSFLVIYHKDWSKTLEGLNEIKTYYAEEQDELENQKTRADVLFENTKKDLETRAKETIDNHQAQALELVAAAKNSYPENLLAGYVDRFQKDADDYDESAIRWLRRAFLNFILTILIAIYFLGHLRIEARPLNSMMIDQLLNGFIVTGILYIMICVAVLASWRTKQRLANWLSGLDVNREIPAGFWTRAEEAAKIAIGFILLLVPVYFLIIYFHISIETPAISAESFLVPKESKVNWSAMLSAAAPRIVIFLLLSAITLFCARMYRIQKHLESVNRYRATALASFSIFIDSVGEETDASRTRKEKLFDELASLIYSPIQTGFTDDQKLRASDLAKLVASAVGNSKSQ